MKLGSNDIASVMLGTTVVTKVNLGTETVWQLLSAPSFQSAPNITGGDTLNFSTDHDCTVYYVFVLRGASEPSDATIKAGFSLAISGGTGSGSADISGLANGLYDLWYLASANGLDSAAVKAELTINIPIPATIPDAFAIGDWSVADAGTGGQLNVTIASLPDDGGDTITDVEYRIDGGSWVTSEGVVSFPITSLTDDTEVDIELQAVNGVGESGASDLKSATPTTAAAGNLISDTFDDTWTAQGSGASITGGELIMTAVGQYAWHDQTTDYAPVTAGLTVTFSIDIEADAGNAINFYGDFYDSGNSLVSANSGYWANNVDVSAGGTFTQTRTVPAGATKLRLALEQNTSATSTISNPSLTEA